MKYIHIVYTGYVNQPTHMETRGKFDKTGMLDAATLKSLGVEEDTAKRLADIGNMGLSKSTWSNYKTAERMLKKCGEDTGTRDAMNLPLSQGQVLKFIDWLINTRKAKHGTICSYLSGIRQMHLTAGHENINIRSDLVNLVLAGQRNKETLEEKDKNKPSRLPVTITVMKLLKAELKNSSMEVEEKLLIWAVSCIAFNGGFRIHELLSREEDWFDKRTTLLDRDIKLVKDEEDGKQVLLIWLKWPKEDKIGKGVEVEVFETNSEICQVKALKKWWMSTKDREKDKPAFRRPDGRALTGRRLNRVLAELLGKHFDYDEGSISAHSFRSGITSTLGRLGFCDEDLKSVGRWSSRAFEHYVKLPRTKRRDIARAIGKL